LRQGWLQQSWDLLQMSGKTANIWLNKDDTFRNSMSFHWLRNKVQWLSMTIQRDLGKEDIAAVFHLSFDWLLWR